MNKIESKTVKIVDASDFQYFLVGKLDKVPDGEIHEDATELNDVFDQFYEDNPMDYSWGSNAKTLIGLTEFVHYLRPYLPQTVLVVFDEEVARLVDDGVQYVDLEN